LEAAATAVRPVDVFAADMAFAGAAETKGTPTGCASTTSL
jgi:hypothetical protein